MRLRNFTADTMLEAMALVRQALGPEAIIVSTEETASGGVQVAAAIEQADTGAAAEPGWDATDLLSDALTGHGVPGPLAEKMLMASLTFNGEDALVALAGALASVFTFAPIQDQGRGPPLMLVGPPGAGKTMTTAKLAARAAMAGCKVRLMTADTVRAGAVEQLDAFARILRLKLFTVESHAHLQRLVKETMPDELVLIDSPGINPYSATDRRDLVNSIAAAGAEPLLVMGAGGDTIDAIEMARIFRDLGVSRMAATRLDLTHRLGSLLTAAEASKLAFAELGVAPSVADGLVVCNPVTLARRLLAHTVFPEHQTQMKRGAL
jgi:flagellar biosynthesis protein FlhF